MKPWDGLGEDLRESNRDFARRLSATLEQLRCVIVPIGKWQRSSVMFSEEEIERLAMVEHERFVAERRAQGWTFTDGPKDETRKTSPTLVPWSDLPEEEREKDRAAICDIEALLAGVGLQVMRLDASLPA